ncbi:MAG: hypothetical protein L3J91_01500 [Thermoplasmata archaeon]|nr:hypothetical protein [Thermoplasmata archaeon]
MGPRSSGGAALGSALARWTRVPYRSTLSIVVALMCLVGSNAVPGVEGAGAPSTAGAAAPTENVTGAWTDLGASPDQPFGLSHAALAWDPGQGLGVLYGGRIANGPALNGTWVNDGDHPGYWDGSPTGTTPSPPALLDAGLAYVPVLGGFLLFGGTLANGSAYGGTWEYTNFVWADVSARVPGAPPADRTPAIAYDADTGRAVFVSSTEPGATWTFGASGWTELPSSQWVSARTGAKVVADAGTGGVLLFGGVSVAPSPESLNDTWMFRTAGWVEVPTTVAPPGGAGPMLSDDLRLPGVVLFSGGSMSSTWTFTASGWTEWLGGPNPPPRTSAEFYYDSDSEYDSLFGGIAPNGTGVIDNWGWSLPPPVLDPTLGAAPIGASPWIEAGAIVAVPIVLAFLLLRRPPRAQPTDAPASAPAAA